MIKRSIQNILYALLVVAVVSSTATSVSAQQCRSVFVSASEGRSTISNLSFEWLQSTPQRGLKDRIHDFKKQWIAEHDFLPFFKEMLNSNFELKQYRGLKTFNEYDIRDLFNARTSIDHPPLSTRMMLEMGPEISAKKRQLALDLVRDRPLPLGPIGRFSHAAQWELAFRLILHDPKAWKLLIGDRHAGQYMIYNTRLSEVIASMPLPLRKELLEYAGKKFVELKQAGKDSNDQRRIVESFFNVAFGEHDFLVHQIDRLGKSPVVAWKSYFEAVKDYFPFPEYQKVDLPSVARFILDLRQAVTRELGPDALNDPNHYLTRFSDLGLTGLYVGGSRLYGRGKKSSDFDIFNGDWFDKKQVMTEKLDPVVRKVLVENEVPIEKVEMDILEEPKGPRPLIPTVQSQKVLGTEMVEHIVIDAHPFLLLKTHSMMFRLTGDGIEMILSPPYAYSSKYGDPSSGSPVYDRTIRRLKINEEELELLASQKVHP